MISCKETEAYNFLANLVGQPLRYGLKSPDMDLYDFGFGDDISFLSWDGKFKQACTYAVHLTCGIKIYWKENKVSEYCGDTPHEIFHEDICRLLGLHVMRVALSEKNDLWLDLGLCWLVIVTFEDGDESWRFFMPGKGISHLVASNLWLKKDID